LGPRETVSTILHVLPFALSNLQLYEHRQTIGATTNAWYYRRGAACA